MGGIGIQILAILGGSMLPIYVFPDTLQTVANIAPINGHLRAFKYYVGNILGCAIPCHFKFM